ncbi:probable L-type lectin-domain containing receptor kinase S.5 [Henckelia pumila]|uniref:probable L-type lectin-domain containing receptor kinase S.5 n=1 Tax=Henckelia pumila TaxID=405737 RepID=UPI003C6E794E
MAIPATIIAAVAIFLSLISTVVEADNTKLETFSKQYGDPFDESYYGIFEVEKPATISNGALQVTLDSASGDMNLTHQSGRVFFKQPFKLWPDAGDINNVSSTVVGSFNSSFLINIYRPKNETPGEGLAFVIAPDLNLPGHSSGEFLGLTNSSTDGNPGNNILAVEFDTFKQDFDVDDNHVGININSVKSVVNTSLTPHNITLAPMGAKFYNVWVDYDGVGKFMQVYITEQENKTGPTPPKPVSPILSYNLNLRDHVRQYSYFGFSASTGEYIQLNCVLRWNLTVHYFPENDGPWLKIVLGVGIPVVVVLMIGAFGLGCYIRRRRIQLSNPNLVGALKTLPGTPREFGFRDLKKATGNFDGKNKLGQGGYGVVYRGFLVNDNLEIAVKWFSRESIKGQDDFLAELTIINRLRHKNLVKLLGWCHKNGKLLLVYEYMPNGSLDKHLFAPPSVDPLPWNLRYNVVSGVASALHYLHNEYEQKVVHRDLKASNIMLDSSFNARLGDFGLARALENEKTSYAEAEGVLGTMGYIAPECFHTGKATQQSDVYAFGAVLLELVCGRPAGANIGGFNYLVDWVWLMHRDGKLLEAVDPRLGDEYVAEEATRLLLLGLACSHPSASERPKAEAILQMITSKTVPVPFVPSFRPAFVWPSAALAYLNSSSTGTTSMTRSGWSQLEHSQRENHMGYSDSSV